MFWVISVYFNVRNILPMSGTFNLGHPVYKGIVNTCHFMGTLTFVSFALKFGKTERVASLILLGLSSRNVMSSFYDLFFYLTSRRSIICENQYNSVHRMVDYSNRGNTTTTTGKTFAIYI